MPFSQGQIAGDRLSYHHLELIVKHSECISEGTRSEGSRSISIRSCNRLAVFSSFRPRFGIQQAVVGVLIW